MTLLTSLKTVWADRNARAMTLGLGFLVIGVPGLIAMSGGDLGGTSNATQAVVSAPVAKPAHELAWLAEDPAMAKRMFAECGDLTQVQCEKYWEIKRLQAQDNGRETYGEFLERGRQRSNDLAFCRQNPSDWYCRNGQYSGQY